MIKRHSIYLVLILFTLLSCDKLDDYSKIKVDYNYKASFSIPVGDTSLLLAKDGIHLPPLWLKFPMLLDSIDTIWISKSIQYNFSKIIFDIDKINALWLNLLTVNDFPNGAAIYLYFADGQMIIRDSLKNGLINIPSAKVAKNGSVIEKGSYLQEIEISKDQFQSWGNIRNIIFKGYITNQDTSVYNLLKYYPNYKLFIGMGLRVDLDFNYNQSLK